MSPIRKPSGVVTQKLKNTGSGEEVSHDEGIYASPSETPQRRSAHPEDLRLGVESRLSELKTKQNNSKQKQTPIGQNDSSERTAPETIACASRPPRRATAPGHSCTRGSAPTLESAQPGEPAPRVHGGAARVQDP